jgi:hypothetical protein
LIAIEPVVRKLPLDKIRTSSWNVKPHGEVPWEKRENDGKINLKTGDKTSRITEAVTLLMMMIVIKITHSLCSH